jgi:hypothetical protein
MPVPHTVDSPDAPWTLDAYLTVLPPRSRHRGRDYHREGRVMSVTRFDDKTLLGKEGV